MKLKRKYKVYLITFLALLVPTVAFSQGSGLVPCDGTDCRFEHIGIMINRIIKYIVYYIYPVVFTISLVWAGILFLTAAGKEGQVTKAKKIIQVLIYGLIIMLMAWLVIYNLLKVLGVDSAIS